MDDRPQGDEPKARTYEQASPFFQPLWRRVAITALVALWFAMDAYHGNTFWSAIAALMFGYAIWTFFVTWPKTPDDPSK